MRVKVVTQLQGYRITGRFTVACLLCAGNTTLKYARTHNGQCKHCSEPTESRASREEQQARYIDCGPAAWDDR